MFSRSTMDSSSTRLTPTDRLTYRPPVSAHRHPRDGLPARLSRQLATCLVAPIYTAVKLFDVGIYTAGVIATFYITVMALGFILRYRTGRWKSMRVIEGDS